MLGTPDQQQRRFQAARLLVELFKGNPSRHGETLPNDAPRTLRFGLTADRVADHLAGACDVGSIPLRADDTCLWCGIDLDDNDRSAAFQLRALLGSWGLFSWVFTSRRRGFHILVFFAGPVAAWTVRELLRVALERVGLPPTTERFPKQDSLSETLKGAGSWLRLPYYGLAEAGRRVALGADGEALTLQEFLGGVERVPAVRVLELVQEFGLVRRSTPAPPPEDPQPEPANEAGIRRAVASLDTRRIVLPASPALLGLPDSLADAIQRGAADTSRLWWQVALALAWRGYSTAFIAAVLTNPAWGISRRHSATGQRLGDLVRTIARAVAQVGPQRKRRPRYEMPPAMVTTARSLWCDDAVKLALLEDLLRLAELSPDWVAAPTIKGMAQRLWKATADVRRQGRRRGSRWSRRTVFRHLAAMRREFFNHAGLVLMETVDTGEHWPTHRPRLAWRLFPATARPGALTAVEARRRKQSSLRRPV